MANAYSVAQFFGWEWGRHKKPWEAPRFTLAWIIFFALALAIVLTDVDVMSLVEYAVLFSIVVLPLTYLPLMLLASDKKYMGAICEQMAREGPRLALLRRDHCRRGRRRPALHADLGRRRDEARRSLKLVSQLLDLPIIDKDERYCGIVDDVELTGGPGKETRGQGAARRPRRLSRTAAALGVLAGAQGRRRPRRPVPLDKVDHDRHRGEAQMRRGGRQAPRDRGQGARLDPAAGCVVMRLSDLRDAKVKTARRRNPGPRPRRPLRRRTHRRAGVRRGELHRAADRQDSRGGGFLGSACAGSKRKQIVVMPDPPQRMPRKKASASRTRQGTRRPNGPRSKR